MVCCVQFVLWHLKVSSWSFELFSISGNLINNLKLKLLFPISSSLSAAFGFVKRALENFPNFTGNFAAVLRSCKFLLITDFIKKRFSIFRCSGIQLAPRGGRGGFLNFDNIADYIDEYTLIEPIRFYKLDYLFRLYAAFLALILLANLLHYFLFRQSSPLRLELKRLLERLRRALKRAVRFLREKLIHLIGF